MITKRDVELLKLNYLMNYNNCNINRALITVTRKQYPLAAASNNRDQLNPTTAAQPKQPPTIHLISTTYNTAVTHPQLL